jgi:arylsulfatase A-like enzyme
MITRLDRNVGRLVELLERRGLDRNTLIVFASDNGATFEFGNQGASAALDSNRPLRGQKRTLWEGGIRVPAFISWPARIPAGQISREPVHMIDLFPTLLSAAGTRPGPSRPVGGADLLRLLTGSGRAPARTLFWEWQSEGADQVSAMWGNLKLIVTRGGKPELYDVAADPSERRDLAASFPREVKELQAELKAWLATQDSRCTE